MVNVYTYSIKRCQVQLIRWPLIMYIKSQPVIGYSEFCVVFRRLRRVVPGTTESFIDFLLPKTAWFQYTAGTVNVQQSHNENSTLQYGSSTGRPWSRRQPRKVFQWDLDKISHTHTLTSVSEFIVVVKSNNVNPTV